MRKMLLNLLVMGCCLLWSTISLAQNKSWILAPNYYNFAGGSIGSPNNLPTSGPADNNLLTGYDGQAAGYSQNIITNPSGQILFFVVDGYVFARNGSLIDVFGGQYNAAIGKISETVIVPDPEDCNLFHFLGTREAPGVTVANALYGKLRVSYNASGQVNANSGFLAQDINDCESKFQFLSNISVEYDDYGSEHDESPAFAVTPLSNGVHKVFILNSSRIFQFTIGPNSFTYNNYLDLNGVNPIYPFLSYTFKNRYEIEVIQLTNGNFRLAVPLETYIVGPNYYTKSIGVFDYNASGTFIAGSDKLCHYPVPNFLESNLPTDQLSGIELSPDGSKVFVSHYRHGTASNYSTLDFWDLSTASPTKTVLSNLDDFKIAQLEIDVNGNILAPRQSSLARISNPNTTPSLNISAITTPNYAPVLGGISWPLRLLQDQIDGMNYSSISPAAYDQYTFTATANATWIAGGNPLTTTANNTVYIEKELRIPAGITITIRDMTLKFSEGARLVIENGNPNTNQQGGKLILQGTTLTSNNQCGSNGMWLGVEVWGNSNIVQGSPGNSRQGVLRMYNSSVTSNNSRIENAIIGVLLSKRTSQILYNPTPSQNNGCDGLIDDLPIEVVNVTGYDNARNGGVIVAENSPIFYNNLTGVYFLPYSATGAANNISYFRKTNFIWNQTLNGGLLPGYHVILSQVKGINFRGCEFRQDSPTIYPNYLNYGVGIFSILSTFNVDGVCNAIIPPGNPCPSGSWVPSKFVNLDRGISSYGGIGTQSYTTNESTFDNCRFGIISSAAQNSRVTTNDFIVRDASYQTAGMWYETCNGYKIEENKFHELSLPNSPASYGAVIRNSGQGHNEVYKNAFEFLHVGGQSELINGSQDFANNNLTTGLQWKCNMFKDITLADLGINGVIDKEQGTVETSSLQAARLASARNVFSVGPEPGTLVEHDIMMADYGAVWPYEQAISYVHLDNVFHKPNDRDANVSVTVAQYNLMNVVPSGSECPSLLNSKTQTQIALNDLRTEIDDLQAVIDRGGRNELLEMIYDAPNGLATRDTLLSVGSVLSDEVLKAYLDYCTVSSYVKEVMVYNSSLSKNTRDEIQDSDLPVSSKIIIANAQGNLSEGKILRYRLKRKKDEYSSNFSYYVNLLSIDSDENYTDTELISELLSIGDRDSKKALLEVYTAKGDATNAQVLRDELASTEHPDYIYLMETLASLYAESSINEALKENGDLVGALEYLKTSPEVLVAGKAKNILDIYTETFEDPIFLPLTGSSAMAINETVESKDEYTLNTNIVSVYPNPSTGKVYFDLPNQDEDVMTIELFDLSGKKVTAREFQKTNGELIDFSDVQKGTYMVRITLGTDYTESQLLQLK